MKSSSRLIFVTVTFASLLGAREGWSQQAPPSLPSSEPALDPITEDFQEQIDDLKEKLKLRDEQQRQDASRLSINGYLDVGFFVPLGNRGIGWVRDVGNRQFPDRANFAWTFLGDILATAVNSRGEPADLGDAPGIDRHDSVDSDGAAGFLVNEVNMRLGYQLSRRALLRTSINFVPRSGRQDFSLGDTTDVDVAELEYMLTEDGNTSFFAGKTMPVFGIEYKERKSDQRFGVTPSLIYRYTAGPQLGLKLRSKLLKEWVIVAAAVSNNSSVIEPFHFHSEIDKNSGKTLSGRVAVSAPMGLMIGALEGDRLEIGASGLSGPQDRALNNDENTLFWGVDLQYLSANFALKAQIMKGDSPGLPAQGVWQLDLKASGYAEIDWQILSWLGVLGRAGLRNAEVMLGEDRIYITRSRQFTGGVRLVFNPNAMLKLEYVHNREYDGVDQIRNDIATSSLVLHF
jgi:hypothetical protein